MTVGYIYILSNPSFPHLLKIGRTTKMPKERAEEISAATGVPTPYEVEYEIETSDPEQAEENIHKRLEKYRSNTKREFFRLPLDQSIGIVNEEIVKLLENEIDYLTETFESKINQLRHKLKDEIETKKKLLKELKPQPPRKIKYEGYGKNQKEKATRLYENGINLLKDSKSYDFAINQLRNAAVLGNRKAQYFLFEKRDASNFSDPMLTDKEFYEIGIEFKNIRYIERSAQMGNKQAKKFFNDKSVKT